MTLQRALRVNTRVLTGIAFSTLAGTGKLSLPLVVMGFISLIMSAGQEWKWGAGRPKFRLSQAGWNGLLIVACLAVVGDFLSGDAKHFAVESVCPRVSDGQQTPDADSAEGYPATLRDRLYGVFSCGRADR